MTPWLDDEPRRTEPEPARSAQARGPVCTEAERAYLDLCLGDKPFDRRELERLRTRIAAERLDQTKRTALVRAWADCILARMRWEKTLEGVDLGGTGAPLYEELQREAAALAESEGSK